MQETWSAVDAYISDCLIDTDPVLQRVLQRNKEAGLPPHDVSAPQGRFLQLLALPIRARRVLEIGTLGGYSTIWLARALPNKGLVITLEADQNHADVARANLDDARPDCAVEVRVGPAVQSLADLIEARVEPFDFIFIDADKPSNPAYLEAALKLSRPGTLIIGDNVVRDGQVVEPNSSDPRVQGVRSFFEILGSHPQLSATALQTVGSKGYDGFTLALVR